METEPTQPPHLEPKAPPALDVWRRRLPPSLVVLGAVALAILGVGSLFVGEADGWLVRNELPLRGRLALSIVAASVGSLATILAQPRPFSGSDDRLRIWSKRLAPLALLALVPTLLNREIWKGHELALLATLLVWGLAAERLLAGALATVEDWAPPARLRRFATAGSLLLLAVGVAYYIARVGTLTNIGHRKMMTMSSDLAEFDNLFFNALHGHPFRAPAIEGELTNWSALKVHAEFGLYLLLPFYALSPGPEALLWIQTSIIALTAIPIFLLARARLGSGGGLVFGLGFLLLPAVARPNFYDFHFTPLGMLLVAWLAFFLDALDRNPSSKRLERAVWIAFALALTAREDVSLGLVFMGIFVFFQSRQARIGAWMAGLSLGYFFLMKFAVMPRFGSMWFDNIYQDLKAQGAKGFGAVALTLVSNPAFVLRSLLTEPKLLYFLHMTAPLLALWLRRPVLWLAILPGFVSTLLVTNRPPMFDSAFQYTYLWVPYVVVASVLAISMRETASGASSSSARTATLASLSCVLLAVGVQFGVLLGGDEIRGGFNERTFETSEADRRRLESLERIRALIPSGASVAATEAEGPHVSTRLVMYSLKFTLGRSPDYILFGHAGIRSERDHIGQALASGEYGLIRQEGPFSLLKRGAPTEANAALRRFGVR
ncbi:MAG TPA: DUF2079 domain-containing protein [Polyangiaceae bacterium]|nr:DUF2079 domain-containing protein [Polyangiaceae bacterium]